MLQSSLSLLLLLVALLNTCISVSSQCSLTGLQSEIKHFDSDTGMLSCVGGDRPGYACRNDSNITYTSPHTITKENEGFYQCCCSCNPRADCTTTAQDEALFALPTPPSPNVSRSATANWGEQVKIQCPYIPGLLYEKYMFSWSLRRGSDPSLLPLLSISNDVVTHIKETNELVIKNFTALFEGIYFCSLRSKNNLPFQDFVDVEVRTTSNTNNPTIVTQEPAQKLVNNDGTASLQCSATVSKNQSMGFRMISVADGTDITMDIHTNNESCKLYGNNLSQLKCNLANFGMICDYNTPYRITCNLEIGQLTESSFVECYLFDTDPTIVIDYTRTGLYLKPDTSELQQPNINPITDGGFGFKLSLSNPITVSPVEIHIAIDNQSYTQQATITNDYKQLIANFTDVKVSMLTQAQYRIMFQGNVVAESNFTLNITTTQSTSITSATTIEPTLTSVPTVSVSSSSLLTSTGINPTIDTILSSDAISGIAGSFAFILLCILLCVIVVTIVLLNRTIAKKKQKYQPNHDHRSGSVCPEANELLPTHYGYNNNSHLSPENIRSETYSQVSTIDTYVDEQSPRRHPPSQQSSRSSQSSSSCPSTHNLHKKPLPRYGIPDHHPQYQPINPQYSLPLTALPEITLITPTPTMENHPGLADYPDCCSPTGTEPFSNPNTPIDEKQEYFTSSNMTKENPQNRPSNLPIGNLQQTGGPQRAESGGGATPLSDQTMIGVLLYLQHKDCNNRTNCQTCKLIDRHFERIADKYGDNTLTGIIKTLNTPGADGTLKHLRRREKREKQRIRSPHKQQVAPLGVVLKRQRSHSASHIDDDELTFSSTETDEDSLKPSNRKFKPLHKSRKAVTDDERDDYDYHHRLPLQKINEGFSLSQHDIPHTPLNFTTISRLPGKGSETDSTDESMSSRSDSNPHFDSYKGSGLSMSYMKSPDVEESLPIEFLKKSTVNNNYHVKMPSTTNSYMNPSGYETDSVFYHERAISSSSDSAANDRQPIHPPPHPAPPLHTRSVPANGHTSPQYYHDGRQTGAYSDDNSSVRSGNLSYKSGNYYQSNSQSDYLKIAARRGSREKSNLSLNSMHSTPDKHYNRYTSNGSNGSNHSNHSVHSESALHYHPRTHTHQFYSPPQQRKNKNGRTPSPIQLLLPSEESSSTPI